MSSSPDDPWLPPHERPVPAFDHSPGDNTSRFQPEIGEAICARVAAGETIGSICADPRMPCRATLYRWLKVDEDFAEAYGRVRDARCADAIDTARLKRQATVWRRAHERRLAGKPPRDWVSGQKSRYTPEAARAFCLAIATGRTLAEATAQPGMPSVKQVYTWLKRFPGFRADYVQARQAQQVILDLEAERFEYVASLLPNARIEAQAEARRLRGRAGRLTAKIWRALPEEFAMDGG